MQSGEGIKRKGQKEEWIQPRDRKEDVKRGMLVTKEGPEGEEPSLRAHQSPGGRRKQSFHGKSEGAGDCFIPLGLQKKSGKVSNHQCYVPWHVESPNALSLSTAIPTHSTEVGSPLAGAAQ